MFLRNRYNYLALLFITYFLFIIYNIYSLQILNIDDSLKRIDDQTYDVVYLSSPRGEIFDTNNNILATSTLEPHLFINLRKINNENINQYKQYLKYNFEELTNNDLLEIFNSKEILFMIKNISEIDYTGRQSLLELDAFEIFDYPIRQYKFANIASHVIGYIGKPTSEEFE